jgi:hypothetical protein
MPQYGVNVQMTTSFRGVQQPFGYTFHYNISTNQSDAQLEQLLDGVVANLKPMHSSAISFTFGRVWTSGGTKAENNMRVQKQLTGTGTNASSPNTNNDKERAFLVRIRAGQDSRGRPVYLRKWFHLEIAALGGLNLASSQLANTAALDPAQRTQLVNWMDQFRSITTVGGTYTLVAESGRQITGATTAHPYYEHHQLGDKWRSA